MPTHDLIVLARTRRSSKLEGTVAIAHIQACAARARYDCFGSRGCFGLAMPLPRIRAPAPARVDARFASRSVGRRTLGINGNHASTARPGHGARLRPRSRHRAAAGLHRSVATRHTARDAAPGTRDGICTSCRSPRVPHGLTCRRALERVGRLGFDRMKLATLGVKFVLELGAFTAFASWGRRSPEERRRSSWRSPPRPRRSFFGGGCARPKRRAGYRCAPGSQSSWASSRWRRWRSPRPASQGWRLCTPSARRSTPWS